MDKKIKRNIKGLEEVVMAFEKEGCITKRQNMDAERLSRLFKESHIKREGDKCWLVVDKVRVRP